MATRTKEASSSCARKLRKAKQPQPVATEVSQVSEGRTPNGRFARANAGGPGNPHARHCARMLALLRASISDEDMLAIIRALVEKARAGDVSAAKLLMSYKLGKPGPAPNPDEIDRDEWEHYQRDTINLQEVQQVLGSFPARVGNDIARTALPIVTRARTEEFASQLAASVPAAGKVTKRCEFAPEQPRNSAPIPNEISRADNDAAGVRSTTNDCTTNDPRQAPIPNRKSAKRCAGKSKPEKLKPHWLEQMKRKIQ